jgi:hypothetical protein
MDDKLMFEELTEESTELRTPVGSHHYVADEDIATEDEED